MSLPCWCHTLSSVTLLNVPGRDHMSEQLQRKRIWGGWLRFSHLAIGLSTLFLLMTGGLIEHAPSLANAAVDFHYYAASVLIFGLIIRFVLAFRGDQVERIHSLIPSEHELTVMKDMLVFYISLGRTPIPRWYAHNPLWKPVYLALYLLLVVMVFTGWVMPDTPLMLGFYLPSLHGAIAGIILWTTVAHIVAVVLHDYRGIGADVSSVVNGHRLFTVEKKSPVELEVKQVSVSLDQIIK